MHIPRQPKKLTLALVFAVLLLLTAGIDASAQSPCRVGFLNGTAPANIDGDNAITSGTTREWSDASVTSSGDPCFGFLLDQDNATPGKPVRVASKRYTRSAQNFIGFYVEVMDSSTSGPLSSGSLASGERFIVQFDPNHSLGTALGIAGALDFRVVVEHAWQLSGTTITDARVTLSDSSITQCSRQNWTAGAAATGLVVAAKTMTGGYKFELEIPLTLIGISGAFPTSEIGIAYAVINDYGGCLSGTSGSSCPNSGGVGFPGIPLTTLDNPASGCHASWVIPDNWASSSSSAPPAGDVRILRTPDWWDSQSLLAFPCGSTTAGYTYFPTHPCKVELKARLENSTGTTQARNIVFLWAKAGSGDPLQYNFISLVSVNVPNGSMQGPFGSGLWGGMPPGQTSHPCVRAYILPGILRPDFDGDDIRAITTKTQVDTMVAKYGLIDDNWAQKNITRHNTATDCDFGSSCFAARNDPGSRSDASRQEIASLSPPSAPTFASGGPRVLDNPGSLFRIGAPSPAATEPSESVPQGHDPPVFDNPGHRIVMAPEELRTFSRDNVVVQVRTFETEQPTQTYESYYRFARSTGGVIHLFPVRMLETRGFIPFEFDVTGMALANATSPVAGPRVLTLGVDVLAPPSLASNVQILIDTTPQPIAPGETRVIRGILRLKGQQPGNTFKRWGLSLHAGVSIPHGNFSNLFNPGPNFAVDLEYRITPTFSVEGIYGFHRFRGATFGPVSVGDLTVHQFSFNGKVYGTTSPVRPFFNFGGGAYNFSSGGGTHGGLNIGAGVQFDVTPTFAVEGVYNFHNVFTSGSNTRFSGLQGGVRFRF
jgi:outer membrane protein with beta-barrel domain